MRTVYTGTFCILLYVYIFCFMYSTYFAVNICNSFIILGITIVLKGQPRDCYCLFCKCNTLSDAGVTMMLTQNKCWANAKRPCDCNVLCLRPKVHCAVVRPRFVDVTSFGSAEVAYTLMQQRSRSVYASISGGRKHFPCYIFRLFHSWLTTLQLCSWKLAEVCRSRRFSKEVDHFRRIFWVEGDNS